ncbi:MAG: hypothetical protein WC627_00590 [Legionella sp.]|jgi:uncharacterized protein YfkK (UPF0435 family)
MTTIFLSAVQALLRAQLNKRSAILEHESTALGHNHDLASEQKDVIDKLIDDDLMRFKSSDRSNDKADLEKIIAFIEAAREKIKQVRADNDYGSKIGKTIPHLNDLIIQTKDFYTKVEGIKSFNFLNRSFTATPENYVYYRGVYYLGDDIYSPQSRSQSVRTQKEAAIEKRLRILNSQVLASTKFEDRKRDALQAIADLNTDNSGIVDAKKAPRRAIPQITFLGFGLKTPKGMTGPGKGRFKKQFGLAEGVIKAMTIVQFKPDELAQVKPEEVVEDQVEDQVDDDDDDDNNNNSTRRNSSSASVV